MENLNALIGQLRRLPNETEWLEFKHNNYDPDTIGEDISALANSAALNEKSCAYMIWGVNNTTHEVVGTEYSQYTKFKGNQELESWLRNLLSKNTEFEFHSIKTNGRDLVVLVIHRAVNHTVMFKKTEYIRVGSYTKKLSEYPTIQAQLWDRLRSVRFEEQFVKQDLKINEALSLIDYSVYFDIKQEPQPSSLEGVMHFMIEEAIILKQDNGLYGITNMGALLFAKRLSDFPRIARKAIRMEMRLEFAMEGLRFFDLVRWGIVEETLNNFMSVDASMIGYYAGTRFIKGQHEIWPIPQIQLDLSNLNSEVLKQNPGY